MNKYRLGPKFGCWGIWIEKNFDWNRGISVNLNIILIGIEIDDEQCRRKGSEVIGGGGGDGEKLKIINK